MQPAIAVNQLSKQYVIGAKTAAYRTLRESIAGAVAWPLRWWRRRDDNRERFWALRDITFTVAPGEVVGIIGRNGAGKSTLLKVLSRIVEPTSGRAELRGRVGSLLEVGTGFHHELTGRENIYLSGAILGMSRREIKRQFDEIVAFAEVDKFLDMPVKRYSSGMYVRLAFAVAAHLRPEILIVDEVLAVGDAPFQQKCLGKMRDATHAGRTVLFVSHNMTAVENLCTRCIYLRDGQIVADGAASPVVREYLRQSLPDAAERLDLQQHQNRTRESKPYMRSVAIRGEASDAEMIRMGGSLSVEVSFVVETAIRPVLGVVVKDQFGTPVFGINNRVIPGYRFDPPVTAGVIRCRFDHLPLMPGSYLIDLYFGDEQSDFDVIRDALMVQVESADVFGSGKLPSPQCGPVFVPAVWELA
jgi:lipopolysaccharide transport system ATP-binding protein